MKKILIIIFGLITLVSYSQDLNYYKSNYDKWNKNHSDVINYDYSIIDKKIETLDIPNNVNIDDIHDYFLSLNPTNDLEKYRIVYKWVHKNITYDRNLAKRESNRTITKKNPAYYDWKKGFYKRKGVCLHISMIYTYICQNMNLEVYSLCGAVICYETYTDTIPLHAWNIIEYENHYYYIDVTWDMYISNPYSFNLQHYDNTWLKITLYTDKLYTVWDLDALKDYKENKEVNISYKEFITYKRIDENELSSYKISKETTLYNFEHTPKIFTLDLNINKHNIKRYKSDLKNYLMVKYSEDVKTGKRLCSKVDNMNKKNLIHEIKYQKLVFEKGI